jgi:hypothetical protein
VQLGNTAYNQLGTASAYPANRFTILTSGLPGVNDLLNTNGGLYVAAQGLRLTGQRLTWTNTSYESAIEIDGGRSALAAANHGQIRFYTANSQRAVIDESGRVGIGIVAPAAPLDLSTTFSTAGITNSSTLWLNALTNLSGSTSEGNYTGSIFRAGDNNSQALLLYAGGAYPNGAGIIQSKDILGVRNYGQRLLLNPDGGNVGIGTTDPVYKFQVFQSFPLSGTTVINNMTNSGTASNVARSDWLTVAQTNPYTAITSYNLAGAGATYQYLPLYLQGNPTIFTAGNVGIGTANPVYTFQVDGGSASSNCQVCIENPTNTNTGYGSQLVFGIYNPSTSQRFQQGAISSIRENNSLHYRSSLALYSFDGTNLRECMRLTPDGNVGIGVASTSYKLDVNGDLNVSGSYWWRPSTNFYLPGTANNQEWSFDIQNNSTISGLSWQVWSDTLGTVLQVKGDTGHVTVPQRVGIGTASPNQPLEIGCNNASGQHPLRLSNYNNGANTTKYIGMEFRGADSVGTVKDCGQIRVTPGNQDWTTGANMIFLARSADTSSVERMRIDNVGRVGIGTSSPTGRLEVDTPNTTSGDVCILIKRYAGNYCLRLDHLSPTYPGNFIYFLFNNLIAATISMTNATTMVYGQPSDYRLKSNVIALSNSIEFVNKLRPVNFTINNDPDQTKMSGFIAHELQEVIPWAVTGHKDEVDANGKIVNQNIDTGHLVPYLTSAIQELDAKNAILEGTVNSQAATIGSLATQLQTAQNDINLLESRLAAIEALISTNTSAAAQT